MRNLLIAIVVFVPLMASAADMQIVDQYGLPTGYKVKTPPSSLSAQELLDVAKSQGSYNTERYKGYSDAITKGYQEAMEENRRIQYRQDLAAMEKRLSEKIADQPDTRILIRKDLAEAWAGITADLAAAAKRLVEKICDENPKDEVCGRGESLNLEIANQAILSGQMVLVPKHVYQRMEAAGVLPGQLSKK